MASPTLEEKLAALGLGTASQTLAAWAEHLPFVGPRRRVAQAVGIAWLIAVLWVSVLLVMSVTVWQAGSPPPVPEERFLGLPESVYHVVGLYGGGVLVVLSAFGRPNWFRERSEADVTNPA